MHNDRGLSHTHEMYLKVLYRLQLENEVGRVRDMAKGLGVTPSTVSAVLKKLERVGLIKHDRYGLVRLTPAGTRVAQCVARKFDILRAVLIEVFGVEEEVAEGDACMMEHAVSPATVNRMEQLLESIRSGETNVEPVHNADRSASVCSECESTGRCQAIASLDLPSLTADRN